MSCLVATAATDTDTGTAQIPTVLSEVPPDLPAAASLSLLSCSGVFVDTSELFLAFVSGYRLLVPFPEG